MMRNDISESTTNKHSPHLWYVNIFYSHLNVLFCQARMSLRFNNVKEKKLWFDADNFSSCFNVI